MERIKNNGAEELSAFLDELTVSSFLYLLIRSSQKNIFILDICGKLASFASYVLRIKRISLIPLSFFAGHLETKDGESVTVAARKESAKFALEIAEKIIESNTQLAYLNKKYERDTIRLNLSKILLAEVTYYVIRLRSIEAIGQGVHIHVFMRKPLRTDAFVYQKYFPQFSIEYYSTPKNSSLRSAFAWTLEYLSLIRARYCRKTKNAPVRERPVFQLPAVLTLMEDETRYAIDLRGQPHWIDRKNLKRSYKTFILHSTASKTSYPDKERLAYLGVELISKQDLCSIEFRTESDYFQRARNDWSDVMKRSFRSVKQSEKYASICVARLLRKSSEIGMLAISLNVKVFLNSEPHHELADAMLLASGALGISTVVYQFSNLAYINPMMMSTADKFLIFSEMYKKVFVTKNVRPREFIITGYLYDHIPLLVRRNSISHRSKIKDAGAEFIVCYFDESFQNDRWGSTTPKDHSDMVQKLAEMVIADSAIGVIIKSQFIRNTPSRLYKDSALVSAAMNTQRFIELASGTHRNDIYPAEAALAADLCIGHKLGLTAVLEAALCGCRAVFINNNKLKSNWDYLYELANLEFDSIQSLETAITQYRNGDANQQSLGDWTDIIDFFDSYRDSCSVVRLRSIVEELLVANQ